MQTKSIPYTFVRDGYYYFSRRVPNDVRAHYRYPRIVKALNTRSASEARVRAVNAAAKLDSFWSVNGKAKVGQRAAQNVATLGLG